MLASDYSGTDKKKANSGAIASQNFRAADTKSTAANTAKAANSGAIVSQSFRAADTQNIKNTGTGGSGGTGGKGSGGTGGVPPIAALVADTPVSTHALVTDPAAAVAPATSYTPSTNDLYTDLFDSQLQTRTAQINSATESAANALAKALSDSLASQDEALFGLKEEYQAAKNRAAAQSDVGKYNFSQTAAAKGIEGGAAMLPEAYANIGLQNTLGGLDRSRAEETAAIERAKANKKGDYESDISTLYRQQDQDILAAGGQIDAARTQALIDQLLRDTDSSEAAKAQMRQDWLNTLSRYYGTEDAAIADNKADGDTSNDWQIGYLESQKADRLNAQKTYSYSGSSKSSGASSTPEAGIVSTMLSFGDDAKAYEYLVGKGLSQGKTDQLFEYYQSQKGTSGASAGQESANDWATVPGIGRVSYPELLTMVENGTVVEVYDSATDTYKYRKA